MRPLAALTSLLAASASVVSAHGDGHDEEREHAERRRFLQTHTNNLAHCEQHHRASGLEARAIQRRAETAARLMEPILKREYAFCFGRRLVVHSRQWHQRF